MGQRHLFSRSQMFEMDPDQNRNHIHAEQSYVHLGRARAAENGSSVFPIENMSNGGVNFVSPWNSALGSNEYSSSSISTELPHYRAATSGSSYDPFLHPSAAGSLCPVPQNYADLSSSSSYYRHVGHGVEGSIGNLTVGNGRGACKRKSPAISGVYERGSTSRSYNAGSSSDLSISSDLQPEKPISGSQHWPWDPMSITPSYRGSSLSIVGEVSQRNVRSRSTLDLEVNLARTHLSSNPSRHPRSVDRPIDHSGTVDPAGPSASSTTREWNPIPVSPAARWRILSSDTSGLSHDANQFLVGSSSTIGSVEIGGYHHDHISSRNPVGLPHNLHGPVTQAVRGDRSSYAQRAMPAYRAMSSYPRLGSMATSEDGLQSVPESYSSRHSRPLSTIGWRNSDRNGRSRIPYNRSRSHSDGADAHDRFVSEGLMMVDRSALYGSRNMLDQHRDMRLDIDNMSYEDLLALGERIGNVNTGLSEDLISKCLMETIYCSSDQIQEEGTCVICLEEYKNKEEVGTLRKCGHDYHMGCIEKWLSTKNVCPICKAPALTDGLKKN